MLTWELLAAVTGAGLASGRETASFFGACGPWGFAGIFLAAQLMAFLAGAQLPETWQGRWPEKLWRLLNTLLLISVGGAMLAGAGELTALIHRGRWGRIAGMAATLLPARRLAVRNTGGLAWISRLLLAGMTALLLRALTLPPMQAAVQAAPPLAGLLRAAAYGGFNGALLQPVMRRHQEYGRPLLKTALLLACLLALGQVVLLRHPAALPEPMPFLFLAAHMGALPQLLSAVCLYLAILSTLAVTLRCLGKAGCIGVCITALAGFTGVVDAAYPLLGGGCALMLCAMRAAGARKAGNSSATTFHSGKAVL